jgi:carboxyl-terminal processing protease
MTFISASRRLSVVLFAGLAAVPTLLPAAPVLASPAAADTKADDWARQVWDQAKDGKTDQLFKTLDELPANSSDPAIQHLRASINLLDTNIAKRETDRATEIKKVNEELDKHLAEASKDGNKDKALSEAIKAAVEWQMIAPDKQDKQAVMSDTRVVNLIRDAEAAARRAESRADWMTSWELLGRLNILLEEQGNFRNEVKRQTQRLSMIRLYAPKRSWEMRNEKRVADGEKPLPPYNSAGDDFHQKLKGISALPVEKAVARAAEQHVDRVPLATILAAALESVHTLASTPDVYSAFPGLADDAARNQFLGFLDQETAKLKRPGITASLLDLSSLVDRLAENSAATVKIPDAALLHEFGNGAMGALDEFSAIIWPDEVRNFDRQTQGRFVGVGIQIQLDEAQNIKVVTPLDNSPALRVHVLPGDIIRKVNGESTEGLTLDQAVDLITGPRGTDVTLTMERPDPDHAGEKISKDLAMKREQINIRTTKGWRLKDPQEAQASPSHKNPQEDWDWFIDKDAGIGYVRLTQFTDHTTTEFDAALKQMEATGLKGLILDLRYNPGGLLTEAVSITSRFVDSETVVQTKYADSRVTVEKAERGHAKLADLPVVVLVNENSASASEIVSGAIQDYANKGQVHAVLVGERTYGKGSVQNVYDLDERNKIRFKLTTQHWMLPDGSQIHRNPGAAKWGVEPALSMDLLPQQSTDGFKLRQDADVLPLDERGQVAKTEKAAANPEELLTKGLDPQLEVALVLLQSQTLPETARQAMRATDPLGR